MIHKVYLDLGVYSRTAEGLRFALIASKTHEPATVSWMLEEDTRLLSQRPRTLLLVQHCSVVWAIFIPDYKQSCLTLGQTLFYWTVNKFSLCSRRTHYLYLPSLLTGQNPWKRVWNQSHQHLCSGDVQKQQKPTENVINLYPLSFKLDDSVELIILPSK